MCDIRFNLKSVINCLPGMVNSRILLQKSVFDGLSSKADNVSVIIYSHLLPFRY